MHERSQQHDGSYAFAGNAQPTQHDAAARAPWPTPQPAAQVPGPAPHIPAPHTAPQQATMPTQFQYRADGQVYAAHHDPNSVLHPAPSHQATQPHPPQAYPQQPHHAQQLRAHDGTIGVPIAHGEPLVHTPVMGGGMQPNAAPQAWAFPTPNGMQMVQPGAQQLVPGSAPGAVHAAPITSVAVRATRRRMRWETIVPGAAIVLFLAAVGLFISDFDRITGRDTAQEAARVVEAAADTPAADAPPAGENGEVLAQAKELAAKGQFDDAANVLYPLIDTTTPDPQAVELSGQIEASAARNKQLLAQVTKQRKAGAWSKVSATIGELEQLRPLTPSLTKLKATAARHAKVSSALRRARALMKKDRTEEAKKVLDTALKAGPDKRLTALRTKLNRASSAPTAAPKAGNRATTGGGAAGAPAAGGARASSPPAGAPTTPPKAVPDAKLPQVPSVPNPTGPAGGGAAAVTGGGAAAGGGSNCHTHDGVTECH